MITYLTSHIGGSYKKEGKRYPTYLSNDNGLLDSLKLRWKENADVLIISADPNDMERNDGIRDIFEDITYPDSYGHEFYALPDGSYIVIENGKATLFGEAYVIKDGCVQDIWT